jgi:hypothetical protein
MTNIFKLFVESYPYFLLCLVLFLIFISCLLLFPQQRRVTGFSAVLCTPFALTSLYLVPAYWMPQRLGNLILGIEDVLFCLTTGGIAWFTAVFCWPERFFLPSEVKIKWGRYLSCIAAGPLIFGVPRILGLGLMGSTLWTIYAIGFLLLLLQRRLWFLALGGGFIFLGVYSLVLLAFLYAAPHLLNLWNGAAISGLIGVMPLEELVWALGFGFTWPLYMAYVFNVQVRERR